MIHPVLSITCRMLNNAVDQTNLNCSMIRKFRKLMKHELCAADVCQATKNTREEYGQLDWARIEWIFNGTILAGPDGEPNDAMQADIRESFQ